MKKILINIIKSIYFWYFVALPAVIVITFFYSLWLAFSYVEQRDQKIFNTAYEIGRFDQLNESAEEQANACFNISKNPDLNRLLRQYFKDCKLAKTMWAIAQAESSGKQFAVGQNDNGSLDGGWLQVNTIHRRKGETKQSFIDRMHDLEENIKEARKVYDKQGLAAWVTYNSGKYLRYIK